MPSVGPRVDMAEEGLQLWGQNFGVSGCCSRLRLYWGLCFPLH